jgi:hypothetical protein
MRQCPQFLLVDTTTRVVMTAAARLRLASLVCSLASLVCSWPAWSEVGRPGLVQLASLL